MKDIQDTKKINSVSPEFNPPPSRPYMGNLTSQQIGNMSRDGKLGGEMVKRMVQKVEQELTEEHPNQLK